MWYVELDGKNEKRRRRLCAASAWPMCGSRVLARGRYASCLNAFDCACGRCYCLSDKHIGSKRIPRIGI